MLRHLFGFIWQSVHRYRSSVNKIACYHCGDLSSSSRTVYVVFDGNIKPVCCRGCAAILKYTEQSGLQDAYLEHKLNNPTSLE